jgi:hypothetical protein
MFSLSILVIIALINIGVSPSASIDPRPTFSNTITDNVHLVFRRLEHNHRPPHLRNLFLLRFIYRLVRSIPSNPIPPSLTSP